MWRLALKGLWNTKLGVAGIIITSLSGTAILAAVAVEVFGRGLGAYQGLVAFMMMPAIFVTGLLAMPAGYLLQRRAARKGGHAPTASEGLIFSIDLTDPKRLRFALFVAGMSVANVVLLSVVSYEGYHYTESTEFCGTLCHSVMEPEFAAHQRSPHARVGCVECHIGSGASWFVKSKLSGLRQVVEVMTGNFSRPIPTPIHNLRPARDTCEQCHWPAVFHGNRSKVFRRVPADGSPEDPEVTALMLHVGGLDDRSGKHTGIHWHVSADNRVEYRARDAARTEIREVRVVKPDGATTLYVLESIEELPEDAPWHPMDCVDCHNRPTHIYDTAEAAVDRLLLNGRLDHTLPELKRAAMQIVQAEYESRPAARSGMREGLIAFYRGSHADIATERASDIEDAAEILYAEAYAPNVYPELGIRWDTYASRLGHQGDVGCFRCHNDEHETEGGETISQDCDTCHSLIVEEELESEVAAEIKEYAF